MVYDRELLEVVMIHHQRRDCGHCNCGWGELGKSHVGHVLDVYEYYLMVRQAAASN